MTPQFKTDHLFKLKLLLDYERMMFLACASNKRGLYFEAKKHFDRLQMKMNSERSHHGTR
jgi:hypothetical protein